MKYQLTYPISMKERISMSNSHKCTPMRGTIVAWKVVWTYQLLSPLLMPFFFRVFRNFKRQSFNINTESPFDGQQNQSSNKIGIYWVFCGFLFYFCAIQIIVRTECNHNGRWNRRTLAYVIRTPTTALYGLLLPLKPPFRTISYHDTEWRRAKIWIAINCKFHGEILCSYSSSGT